VTGDIVVLVLVNVLMALLGVGLMLLLGIARTTRQLLVRAPLAYGLGLAATGVLGSALELVHAPLGAVELTILAVASLAGGGFKLFTREPEDERVERPSRLSLGVGLVSAAVALVLVAQAAHAYSVRPLREYDGWVIWATKARALYSLDGVRDVAFANTAYEHPDYPLLLPTVEAIGFRALGHFDGTLLHLQLAGLALAFLGAAWTISRATASPAVTGLTLAAIVSAPAVLAQLGWNYADIPVAMLCALGVAALVGWLRSREAWLLPTAVVFLAAGALTKSEGLMFSLAAFLAALGLVAVAERARLRPLFIAGGAFVALILPWRLYVLAKGLHPQDYELSNLFDPGYLADASYRLRPAATELLDEMTKSGNWGLLLPLAACALVTALLRARYDVAIFGAAWLVLCFAGLLLIYWINENPLDDDLFNTSYRTIATLLLGAGLLVPPLVGELGSGRRRPAD
jgi:hypothetical protein